MAVSMNVLLLDTKYYYQWHYVHSPGENMGQHQEGHCDRHALADVSSPVCILQALLLQEVEYEHKNHRQ